MTIKLALPTGDPRASVGEMLETAGIPVVGYEPSSRVLRSVNETGGITSRVFREKDIPIQVALGNYDLGICSDLFLTELQVRFPLQHVVRIGSLPGAMSEVWLCASPESGLPERTLPSVTSMDGARIVSELPNLADIVAVHLRMPGYRLIPLAGSADAYPPEDAEFVLYPCAGPEAAIAKSLVPLARIYRGGLALIANSDSLASAPLGEIFEKLAPFLRPGDPDLTLPGPGFAEMQRAERSYDVVRLAVPDGHAQRATPSCLREAGIEFDGYDEKSYVRRPVCNIPGVEAKVVRPQDMPQLVALGMFDIAISGRDLLHEHLCRFPGSPVKMAVDLGKNLYRIGPVVDQAFPADTTPEALEIWNSLGRPVRIASEFPGTAERFARDHGIQHSTIIPVAGASEGFVPEDADFLVEGTETGTSIRANGLKMLDPFMESTNCVIVRSQHVTNRGDLVDALVERFAQSVKAVEVA